VSFYRAAVDPGRETCPRCAARLTLVNGAPVGDGRDRLIELVQHTVVAADARRRRSGGEHARRS
jgi:hypothetical protein